MRILFHSLLVLSTVIVPTVMAAPASFEERGLSAEYVPAPASIEERGLSTETVPAPGSIEARAGFSAGSSAGEELASAITSIISFIENGIAQDKLKRGEYTNNLVTELHKRNNKFNFIACHTKHTYQFAGKQGVDWTHQHHELDVKIGGTIGYEIYKFKAGTFHLLGDGSYINWAYSGNVESDDHKDPHDDKKNGRTVIFKAP